MKKTIKNTVKIAGIVACAAILFFNLSLNGKSSSNNVDLSTLTKINEANAECWPWEQGDAHGNCLDLSQICVFDTSAEECDPYES